MVEITSWGSLVVAFFGAGLVFGFVVVVVRRVWP